MMLFYVRSIGSAFRERILFPAEAPSFLLFVVSKRLDGPISNCLLDVCLILAYASIWVSYPALDEKNQRPYDAWQSTAATPLYGKGFQKLKEIPHLQFSFCFEVFGQLWSAVLPVLLDIENSMNDLTSVCMFVESIFVWKSFLTPLLDRASIALFSEDCQSNFAK